MLNVVDQTTMVSWKQCYLPYHRVLDECIVWSPTSISAAIYVCNVHPGVDLTYSSILIEHRGMSAEKVNIQLYKPVSVYIHHIKCHHPLLSLRIVISRYFTKTFYSIYVLI